MVLYKQLVLKRNDNLNEMGFTVNYLEILPNKVYFTRPKYILMLR